MPDENEYEVKTKEEKSREIEEIVDKKIVEGPTPTEPAKTQKKGFSVPQIPTERIFKTLTDRETMRQTLHDETLEPHVHLAILLLIVFILAIIISLIGI
jgi:hypothetical protein